MSNIDKYQNLLQRRLEAQQRIERMRSEVNRAHDSRRSLERLTIDRVTANRESLAEAVRQRDYKAIARYSKENAALNQQLKTLKRVERSQTKLNALVVKSESINRKLQDRVHVMAMREATATNTVTQKIAQVKNGIDSMKLKALAARDKIAGFRLNQETRHHDLLNKRVNGFMSTTGKSTAANHEQLKNYDIRKTAAVTYYTNKTTGAEVKDTGTVLSAKNGSHKESAAAMIEVAKAKGWDLSKVQARGSTEFKAEVNRQIGKELEKKQQQGKSANVFKLLDNMKQRGQQNDQVKQKPQERQQEAHHER